MRLSFLGQLLGLVVLSIQNHYGNIFGFEHNQPYFQDVCYINELFYKELVSKKGKNISIDSINRLLPPGNEKLTFYFEQSKAGALQSVHVPFLIGLHRPQNLSMPINRSVAASTAQIYINEEFYINRYIEYTINSVEFPTKTALIGVCILYCFRNVRNQLGEFSALPDIQKVAAASLQLPYVSDNDEFRNTCNMYLSLISRIPRNHSSRKMINLICEQIPKCVKDASVLNSLSFLREILANNPSSISMSNSSGRFGFIDSIRKKFNGRPLNMGLLRLYRIVSRLDTIVTTHFNEDNVDVFGIDNQKQIDSWHSIASYGDDGYFNNISCEESLRLHFKAHPLIPGQESASRRAHLSTILCNHSEHAVNPIFVPKSPNTISFQYLMYLNEYLELPIEFISGSICVFHLSASYTGMYPEFDLATRLAILLAEHISNDNFTQICMENLPKFINLSENTFIPGERIVVDFNKDSNSICSAVRECFKSDNEHVITNEGLSSLMLSVLPISENEYFPQLLHRSKFINKIIERRDKKENINKINRDQLKGTKGLLPPIKAMKNIMEILNVRESKNGNNFTALNNSGLAIKTQKLYSTLMRLALILLEKVILPKNKTSNNPISNPSEMIEDRNPSDIVISIKDILEIVTESLTPAECADSIVTRKDEYKKVYDTVLTICKEVLFTSYPNSFSDLPYLIKLMVVSSDNYGFNFNQLKRIYAYASSSFSVLGIQLKLYPLFSYICRFGSYDNHKKSEYNMCMENFQFGHFFPILQLKTKQKLFCAHVSKIVDDSFFDRIVSFSLQNFAKKSIVEENWINSITDISVKVRGALNEVVGLSFKKGPSMGEANRYSTFFLSKFIRRIQRSRYFGELNDRDIEKIFVNIYANFEQIPSVGSSSFTGNSLRYEFILARDSSTDMNNYNYVSDHVFGLRRILFNDIVYESFPYLIERCSQILWEFISSKEKIELNEKGVTEICTSTFSMINKELPTQITDNSLFINYAVNYYSIPKRMIPKLECIYKTVRKYSIPTSRKPSFEVILNFGLHLINLTHGFKNVNDSKFTEKCNIASLLSNILDMNSETVVYDEKASSKTYMGLSLSYHDENPVDHRLVGYLCNDVQLCTNYNKEEHIYKYISQQTNYDLIFVDSLSGDPLNTIPHSSDKRSSDTKLPETPLFGRPNSRFTQKLEQEFEKYITDGVEIKDRQEKTVKIRGIRILEAIRLFGVFHDSFLPLLKSKNLKKYDNLPKFTGLYSGTNPIKGVNDNNDDIEIFSFENSIRAVYDIAQTIISNSQLNDKTSSLILSKHFYTTQICSNILKTYLPEEFSPIEIKSICGVSFSPFKY